MISKRVAYATGDLPVSAAILSEGANLRQPACARGRGAAAGAGRRGAAVRLRARSGLGAAARLLLAKTVHTVCSVLLRALCIVI